MMLQKAYFSDSIIKKEPHYHDCHQILFITEGTIEICVNREKHEVGAGHIVIFSRFENHSLKILSPCYKRYVLHLDPKAAGIESHLCSLLFNRPNGFCNAVNVCDETAVYEALFERILKERASQSNMTEEMQQLLVSEMLIMVYRRLPARFCFDETVFAIQRQLENNFSEPYTLDTLAKQYNISVSSMAHQFKRVTGVSVMEYLLSCRMAEAKRLLATTRLPVGEIVLRCGFSDACNFARAFKQRNSVTPSAFRAAYKRS